MTEIHLKAFLAVIGLIALIAVLLVSANHMDSTAAAWTRGGAVVVAVSGLFGLLLAMVRR